MKVASHPSHELIWRQPHQLFFSKTSHLSSKKKAFSVLSSWRILISPFSQGCQPRAEEASRENEKGRKDFFFGLLQLSAPPPPPFLHIIIWLPLCSVSCWQDGALSETRTEPAVHWSWDTDRKHRMTQFWYQLLKLGWYIRAVVVLLFFISLCSRSTSALNSHACVPAGSQLISHLCFNRLGVHTPPWFTVLYLLRLKHCSVVCLCCRPFALRIIFIFHLLLLFFWYSSEKKCSTVWFVQIVQCKNRYFAAE